MAQPALKGVNWKSIAELERENFNLVRIQEWAGINFEAKMSRVLDRATARIEIKLKEAERDRQGNFKITAQNQALALNISADLSRILTDAGYTDIVNEHLANYSGLFDQARKLYQASGIPFAFDQADINTLQIIADHDATYFGRLPDLGVAAVEKALAESVLVGSNFQIAAQAIQSALGASGSWLARYAYTYANDSLLNFSAAMSAIRDKKYKPEFYYYAGAIIKTSREFCIARAGKTFPAKMIQEWEKWDWRGKKPGPFLIVRGGWNCKHSMIGVSKGWMAANNVTPETEPGPVPEAPKRRKPPGLEGATYLPGATRLSSLSTWTGPVPGIKEPPGAMPKTPPAPPVKPPPKVTTKTKQTKTSPWPVESPKAKPPEQKIKEEPRRRPKRKEAFKPVTSLAEGRQRLQAVIDRLKEKGVSQYPIDLGEQRIRLTKEMNLDVFNLTLRKLEELQDRAIKMRIPGLHSFELTGRKGAYAGTMGGGEMYINSQIADRRYEAPYRGSLKWEIDRTKTRIAVLENQIKVAESPEHLPMGARDRPSFGARPTDVQIREMKLELKTKLQELKGMEEEFKKPYDPRSTWKQGDGPDKRPQNAIDYFMPGTDEAIFKTPEHEFAHHIHQNLFVTERGQWYDRSRRPLEEYLKNMFRNRSVQPSTYADFNHYEYFAENYCLWRLNRKDLVAPELKALLRKIDDLPNMDTRQELDFLDWLTQV